MTNTDVNAAGCTSYDLRETPCSPDTSQLIPSADSAPIVSAGCLSGPLASEDDLIRVQVKGASRTQPDVEALQSATYNNLSGLQQPITD